MVWEVAVVTMVVAVVVVARDVQPGRDPDLAGSTRLNNNDYLKKSGGEVAIAYQNSFLEKAKFETCDNAGGECLFKKTANKMCNGQLDNKYKCGKKYICCIPELVNQCMGETNENSMLWHKVDAAETTLKVNLNEGNHNITGAITDVNSKLDNLTEANSELERKLDYIIQHIGNTTTAPLICPDVTCQCCPTTSITTSTPSTTTSITTSTPSPTTTIITEGPGVSSNLTWLTVGSDRFVRFSQEMNWFDARALCQSHGLDLYQPKDIKAVSTYLDDNFSNRRYWLGARGNGTHQVWFSGEVLTRSDPWYKDYYNNVGTNDCLAFITYSGQGEKGQVLFAPINGCTRITYIDVLCGPRVSSNLTWLTVGSDRFVRFSKGMDWFDARALCQSHGLDLYQPKDINAVSTYLDDNFSNTRYWLGARGNGTHQVWFSGEVLTRSDPWYYNHYNNVGTNDCLAFITYNGWGEMGQVLFAPINGCTGRTNIDVLCG